MLLENKKFNFLGDSITYGVGTSSPEHIFPNVIKAEQGLCEARNYGISGTRIARQPIDEWGPAYCDRVDTMDADADGVVVFGGVNDFGHGRAKIGTPSDRSGNTFYGACHETILRLYARYPRSLIVFMSPLHCLIEDNPSMGNSLPLKAYVDIIREVTEYYGVPLLDLYSMSGIQPKIPVNRETYCPDGLHPNDAGHAVIASRLTGFLKSL